MKNPIIQKSVTEVEAPTFHDGGLDTLLGDLLNLVDELHTMSLGDEREQGWSYPVGDQLPCSLEQIMKAIEKEMK